MYSLPEGSPSLCASKMRVWVRTELLCIHFDGWQVNFDTWPVPSSQFKEIIIAKALEHFEESSCIFIVDELCKLRGDLSGIAGVLREKCRFFIRRGRENPTEVENLRMVQTDDDIFLCVGDWSGGYDTEILSDSDDEVESCGEWLIEEWNTDDVLHWLETQGLKEFAHGFKEQKIDGMCLKEGLSDSELSACEVQTVGDQKLLKRKIADLVGNCKETKVPKVPKLRSKKAALHLSPQEKDDLLRRRRQVHRKTVSAFPGNKIPIIRGNEMAKKQFEDVVQSCKDLLKPEIGYDEEELRRHIRAILDERRRMVREGYSYADAGESSSTDDSDKKSGEKNICGEERSDSDHSFEASQSKTSGSRGKGKMSSDQDKLTPDTTDDSNSDALEDEHQLPDGATTVPLSTAETILLAYFKKGYTKEIKKEEHLNPLCREMKMKHFKGKDKSELIMILAKELLLKKRVVLKDDADFYCLHRDSISVQ